MEVSAEIDFKVEERGGKFAVILPEAPAAELSDADLTQVAGGCAPYTNFELCFTSPPYCTVIG